MSSGSSLRFKALDSWRGICALLVAAHHLEVHGFPYWQPLVRNAWMFVDFFFVLSGFVIAHAYGNRLADGVDIRSFVIRRFGRLWPLHVTVLAALVLLELSRLAIAHWHPLAGERIAFTADRSVYTLITNLFLVQSLGLHPYETWNGPAWSISTEFFTYLIFAAVCFVAPRRAMRLIVSASLALAGVFVLARFSQFGMRETFTWALPRCVYGFFLGTLVYEAWRRGASKMIGGTAAETAAVVLVIAFVTFVPGHAELEYLATPVFGIAVLVFAAGRGEISHLLTMRAPSALGRWSYSIYMVHTLVLVLFFSGVHVAELALKRQWLIHLPNGQAIVDLGNGAGNSVLFVTYLAATVGLAAWTWKRIELPGQAFFGSFVRSRPAVTGAQMT
jgi:peptidoglycan/LPS O-acetylase OafA/YrhL